MIKNVFKIKERTRNCRCCKPGTAHIPYDVMDGSKKI